MPRCFLPKIKRLHHDDNNYDRNKMCANFSKYNSNGRMLYDFKQSNLQEILSLPAEKDTCRMSSTFKEIHRPPVKMLKSTCRNNKSKMEKNDPTFRKLLPKTGHLSTTTNFSTDDCNMHVANDVDQIFDVNKEIKHESEKNPGNTMVMNKNASLRLSLSNNASQGQILRDQKQHCVNQEKKSQQSAPCCTTFKQDNEIDDQYGADCWKITDRRPFYSISCRADNDCDELKNDLQLQLNASRDVAPPVVLTTCSIDINVFDGKVTVADCKKETMPACYSWSTKLDHKNHSVSISRSKCTFHSTNISDSIVSVSRKSSQQENSTMSCENYDNGTKKGSDNAIKLSKDFVIFPVSMLKECCAKCAKQRALTKPSQHYETNYFINNVICYTQLTNYYNTINDLRQKHPSKEESLQSDQQFLTPCGSTTFQTTEIPSSGPMFDNFLDRINVYDGYTCPSNFANDEEWWNLGYRNGMVSGTTVSASFYIDSKVVNNMSDQIDVDKSDKCSVNGTFNTAKHSNRHMLKVFTSPSMYDKAITSSLSSKRTENNQRCSQSKPLLYNYHLEENPMLIEDGFLNQNDHNSLHRNFNLIDNSLECSKTNELLAKQGINPYFDNEFKQTMRKMSGDSASSNMNSDFNYIKHLEPRDEEWQKLKLYLSRLKYLTELNTSKNQNKQDYNSSILLNNINLLKRNNEEKILSLTPEEKALHHPENSTMQRENDRRYIDLHNHCITTEQRYIDYKSNYPCKITAETLPTVFHDKNNNLEKSRKKKKYLGDIVHSEVLSFPNLLRHTNISRARSSPMSSMLHDVRNFVSTSTFGDVFTSHNLLTTTNAGFIGAGELRKRSVISTPTPFLSQPTTAIIHQSALSLQPVNNGYGYKNPMLIEPIIDKKTEHYGKGYNNNNKYNNKVGQYGCRLCHKNFRLMRHLTSHMKYHSNIKRFLCVICRKGFNDTFDLKRHTRTHTGIKPFKCHCGKSFTQRCSLESHERKVHDQKIKFALKERRAKLYVCEECGNTSHDPTRHLLHMKSLHQDNPDSY